MVGDTGTACGKQVFALTCTCVSTWEPPALMSQLLGVSEAWSKVPVCSGTRASAPTRPLTATLGSPTKALQGPLSRRRLELPPRD